MTEEQKKAVERLRRIAAMNVLGKTVVPADALSLIDARCPECERLTKELAEVTEQRSTLHAHVVEACELMGLNRHDTPCDPWTLREKCAAQSAELAAKDAEIQRLRELSSKQQLAIEDLQDMSDAVERLRDIGRVIGCDHVDDPDGRLNLVRCVETTIAEWEQKWLQLRRWLLFPRHTGSMGNDYDVPSEWKKAYEWAVHEMDLLFMTAQPPADEPTEAIPPRPPMLLAHPTYMPLETLRGYTREPDGSWLGTDGSSWVSEALQIDRQHSDPEALKLYDQDLANAKGGGET
jgi:hypothetical protein